MTENEKLELKNKKNDLIMLIENQNKNLLDITTYLKDIFEINDSNIAQKVLIELTDIKNWKYFDEIIQKIENLEQEQQKIKIEINSLKINKSFSMTPQQEEKLKLILKEKEEKLERNKNKIDNCFSQLKQKLNTILIKEKDGVQSKLDEATKKIETQREEIKNTNDSEKLKELQNKLEKVIKEKEDIQFNNSVVWNKKKYYKLKIIINKIHINKINNKIKNITYNAINKDHLNLYIKNLQDDIEALNKKKINPVLNFLLKIFSCGLYSKNKYLSKNINIKNNELNEFLLISKKQEQEAINPPKNQPLLPEVINAMDLQNQSSTSSVRLSSPTMH